MSSIRSPSSWLPKFGARRVQLRSAENARERLVFSRGGGIGGGGGLRARVCGACVGACGLAGEAVVEDAGEAVVEWLVVEASVVQPAGRLQRELAGGWSGF